MEFAAGIRLSRQLRGGGVVVFTLKTTDAATVDATNQLFDEITRKARSAGLGLIAATHLTYNRQEFTLFFERSPAMARS